MRKIHDSGVGTLSDERFRSGGAGPARAGLLVTRLGVFGALLLFAGLAWGQAAPTALGPAPVSTTIRAPATDSAPKTVWSQLVAPGRVRLDYQLGKGAEQCDSEILFRKIFAHQLGEPDPFVLTGPVERVVMVRIEADSPGFRAIVELRDPGGSVVTRWEAVERTCADAGDLTMIHLLLSVFPSSPPPTPPPPKTAEPAPSPGVTKEEFDRFRRAMEARLDAQDEAIDELRERNRALQRALNETRKRMDLTYAISAGALMTANLTSNVGPGAWIGAEGRFGPMSMGLEVRGVFPAPVFFGTKAGSHDYEFDLSQVLLHAVPCGRYSYLFACMVVGVGAEMHNSAVFLPPGESHITTGPVWQFGGRLGAEVPFGETGWGARAWGEVLYAYPQAGQSYTPKPDPEVEWIRSNVSAFFGLGLVLKLGNEGVK